MLKVFLFVRLMRMDELLGLLTMEVCGFWGHLMPERVMGLKLS